MKKTTILALIVLLFIPNLSFSQSRLEKERLARWHINYAGYLIDVGKYMQALESYDTAIELSTYTNTKLDALLGKATLLYTFLDAPEEAINIYRYIRKKFPKARELAYFREGLILFSLNRQKEAKAVLEEYLRKYPFGRFRFQAEAILQKIKKKLIPPVKPPKIVRPNLRVRICKGVRTATIKGTLVCVKGIGCNNILRLRASNGNILLNDTTVSKREIVFESDEPVEVSCGSKRKKLRGKIIAKLKKGRLLIINLIDIEDYLLSVVPSESYSSWPLETLKAQAICARTYAYYQYLHRKDWEYDLVDDEGDQAYKGVTVENPRTTRAVRETTGLVLTYKNRPILAMYTANSGGITADAGAIFDLYKPYLVAKPDPASLRGKMARWEKRFSIRDVERAFRKIGLNIRGLVDIRPAQIGPSGRIIKIKLVLRDGVQIFRTRTTLKRALGLPEILLKITKQNDTFVFNGKGWGHGVGYSQWGSAYMGKTKDYRAILRFYYPATQVKKLW